MFEFLSAMGSASAPKVKITYAISADVPVSGRGLTDAYYADNGSNSAATHGGIFSSGAYTGQGFSYSVDTGTVLQQYTAGTANAFGAAAWLSALNFVIYTGGIWSQGPQSSAAYTQGCWSRPFQGAGGWSNASDDWPAVDGKIWKGFTAAASPNAIYYFGGFNHVGGFNVTNAVYKLTFVGTTWLNISQPVRMPYAAQGVGAVYHDGNYYIYGGTAGAGRLKHMYRMDPATHTFEKLPDLPLGTSASPGIVVKGHIVFLARAADSDNCVIIAYEIATKLYITLEIPQTYRSGYTAHRFGTKAKFSAGTVGYWTRPFGAGNLNADREYSSYIASARISDSIVVDLQDLV